MQPLINFNCEGGRQLRHHVAPATAKCYAVNASIMRMERSVHQLESV